MDLNANAEAKPPAKAPAVMSAARLWFAWMVERYA